MPFFFKLQTIRTVFFTTLESRDGERERERDGERERRVGGCCARERERRGEGNENFLVFLLFPPPPCFPYNKKTKTYNLYSVVVWASLLVGGCLRSPFFAALLRFLRFVGVKWWGHGERFGGVFERKRVFSSPPPSACLPAPTSNDALASIFGGASPYPRPPPPLVKSCTKYKKIQLDKKRGDGRNYTHKKEAKHRYSSSIVFLLSDLIPGACAASNLASDSGDFQNPGALVGSAHADLIFFRASSTCLV